MPTPDFLWRQRCDDVFRVAGLLDRVQVSVEVSLIQAIEEFVRRKVGIGLTPLVSTWSPGPGVVKLPADHLFPHDELFLLRGAASPGRRPRSWKTCSSSRPTRPRVIGPAARGVHRLAQPVFGAVLGLPARRLSLHWPPDGRVSPEPSFPSTLRPGDPPPPAPSPGGGISALEDRGLLPLLVCHD